MERYGGKRVDWELEINNMAEEVQFLVKGMVSILGSNSNTALVQFVLLLKSLKIQNKFMTIILNKEYACEQEALWDLKREHMELIRDARADLNKQFSIKKLGKGDVGVEKLQQLQHELEKINKEESCELLKVAQKHNRIRQPMYEKRRDIIKHIPGFWSTAFLKHHVLGGLVRTEEDRNIFKFLTSIKVEHVKSGYTIIFNFDSNAYFENTKLWKKYTFLEDDGHTKTTASSIRWAQGKGVDEQSFFKWFDEVNERDEVGELIKDELWSDPLICFHDEQSVDDVAGKDTEDEIAKDTEDEEQNE